MKKTLQLLSITTAVLISVTQCSLMSGGHRASFSSTQTNVSFQSVQSASGNMTTPANSSVTYTDPASGDSITIESAKLLIRKLSFHGQENEMGTDSSGHVTHKEDSVEVKFHEGDHVFKTGPYVLNISLDTTVSTVGVVNLPHGTYNMITFQIHKLTPGEQVSDSSFSPVDSSGMQNFYSIIVKGRYNGKFFVFKSSKTFFVRTLLNPPMTVKDSVSNYNATIQTNTSQWFMDEGGHIIDPTNPRNAHRIELAIRRSFHAFKDNNEDGHEDDHFGGGTGDNGNHGNSGNHGNQNGNGNH